MAVRTLPVDLEMTVYAGTDVIRQYRWFPDGKTPANFAGWMARMRIGPPPGPTVLELSSVTRSNVKLDAGGILTVHLTANLTTLLAGRRGLVYTIDLINPDGVVTRFLRGRVVVIRELESAP